MKEKLIEIIKEASEILKEGFYSSKEVNFKGKKDLVNKNIVTGKQIGRAHV